MTIDELAVYLQVSKSSLYKLAQDGKVPGQKVGRHWRFHRVVIDRWLGMQSGQEEKIPASRPGHKPGSDTSITGDDQ